MRSTAVLALLLCAGQAIALPVNSPVNKRDTEVMRCIVEVISDTLSKPGPMPVSQECFETLQGDERILSILRHQNLLKELQDLALQGAKERAHQQNKHSSFEDELSEVLEKQNDQDGLKEGTEEASSKDAAEKRGDSREVERNGGDTDRPGPQASPEPGQRPTVEEEDQAPGEEKEATNTHPPASLPSQKHPGPQAKGDGQGPSEGVVDREKGLGAEQEQQAKREEEEEEEEDPEAGEKAVSEEEGPTAAFDPHPSLGYKEAHRGESQSKALAVDGGGKTGAEEAQEGERERSQEEEEEEEEETAGAPLGPFQGGKSREQQQQQQQEERFSKEWEEAKRWSKMDQLARELTAEKRLAGEEEEEEDDNDPDHSMKLSFQARGYGFRGPGLQLPRGWRPSPQEDTVEAGLPLPVRGYPEEKKEEEGSANRRPEDQELESLSAIEAELEKVAHQLQALRRG